MGKILMAVVSLFLLLGFFSSPINDGIKNWRTRNSTESYTVTTAAGVTSGNVTLSYDLFRDLTAEVIAISSNNTSDVPVANAYTADTNLLNVTGLEADEVRALTVNYYADPENAIMLAIGGFLSIAIIGGLAFMIIWGALKKK